MHETTCSMYEIYCDRSTSSSRAAGQQGSYASAPLVRFSGNGHESAQSPSEATHDS